MKRSVVLAGFVLVVWVSLAGGLVANSPPSPSSSSSRNRLGARALVVGACQQEKGEDRLSLWKFPTKIIQETSIG